MAVATEDGKGPAEAAEDGERSPRLELPPPAVRAAEIRLFYHPPGTLRLQVREEVCHLTVRIHRAAPLSRPGEYLAFLDGKGNEICTIRSLDELDAESRAIAEVELARRYLTARIERILSLFQEAGVSYWVVETHRGRRDFVVQGMQENCVWLAEDHLLLIDVDGNRFEIPSIRGLDERSRGLLAVVS